MNQEETEEAILRIIRNQKLMADVLEEILSDFDELENKFNRFRHELKNK